LIARIVALIFNRWNTFTRMATGSKHGEAITTLPLFQHGIARRMRRVGQTRLHISNPHGKARKIAYLLM